MPQYLALKANFADAPVLHIDTEAPVTALYDCAHHRIATGTDLLESLTSINMRGIDDIDLARIASAAYLLFRDGVDVLEVMRERMGLGQV
jgi:hypothetical protein